MCPQQIPRCGAAHSTVLSRWIPCTYPEFSASQRQCQIQSLLEYPGTKQALKELHARVYAPGPSYQRVGISQQVSVKNLHFQLDCDWKPQFDAKSQRATRERPIRSLTLQQPPRVSGGVRQCSRHYDAGRTRCPSGVAGRAPKRRSNPAAVDRKSTRLNSSHLVISYAVFCL